jgi:tRNA dimethylallyltransferase
MRLAFDRELLKQCWFLAGPTASGKTAVSLELASQLDAEIVALDSMSLYRGMDIGTAKPDSAAREWIPHHLVDILDPSEDYSLAEYLNAAQTACAGIVARGKTPLFVGGTGLYLRSILRGIFNGPPADWDRRRQWIAEAEQLGPETLHQRLAKVDLATADRLHPNDIRRVIRALEVYELTGTPLSGWQREAPLSVEDRTPHVYWLSPTREWLHDRIALRVRQMMDAGLLDEVRRLAAGPISRTARQAVGYKELFDYLESQVALEDAVRLIEDHTRQFAKRQFTWFRNLEECVPVPIQGDETPQEVATVLLSHK